MTQRSRTVLYQGLIDMIEDEVAVGELLSYFPARDVEEPATKEFVAAQVAGVRADLAAMEARIIGQVAEQGRTMMRWSVGLVLSFAGLAVSLVGSVVAMGFIQRP